MIVDVISTGVIEGGIDVTGVVFVPFLLSQRLLPYASGCVSSSLDDNMSDIWMCYAVCDPNLLDEVSTSRIIRGYLYIQLK